MNEAHTGKLQRNGRLGRPRLNKRWGPVAALMGTLLAVSACSSGSTPASQSGGGAPIKIAYLGNQSGSLGSTFAPAATAVKAFVSYENARGGLSGHKLSLQIYDDQSNPSTVLSNARLAVEQGADVIVAFDAFFDTAVPFLQQKKMPVFGVGITPGFFGAAKTNFFSPYGNLIGYETTAGMKWLVDQGKKKIAVVSDTVPGNLNAAHAVAKAVTNVGGSLVYTNFSVDDTNTASLLAVAQRAHSAGATALYANLYGTAPAELQADLNQIGAHADVLNGTLGFTPAIAQQFGSAAQGLLSEVFSATWLSSTIPGVKTYLAAMRKYAPANVENSQALNAWTAMLVLAGAVAKLGNSAPTKQNLINAGNALKNYTGDGMLQPVTFPAMHTTLAPCLAIGQLTGGQWKVVTGSADNPFVCGAGVPAS